MTAVAPTAETLTEAVHSLRPLIEADAPEIERSRRITPRVVDALRQAGVYRMLVPRSLGGSELTLPEYARVMEALAMADGSTAWCVGQNSGICRLAAYLPREGAEEVFGDASSIVSWGNGPGTARPVEGGYVVDFRATTSSGIHHATWLGTQDCDVYDAEGNVVLDKHGEKQRGTCFFRPQDVEMEEVWHVSGLRGTGSDSYRVAGLYVPLRRFALETPQEPGPLYRYNTTNIFATGFAAVTLGIARAGLDALIDIARGKTRRGAPGVLRDQRSAQLRIANAEATLRAARALLHETVETGWRRVSATGVLDMDTRVHLRMATTFAMRSAAAAMDEAYRLAGIAAIFETGPFERRFRDINAATQHIQARDDMLESVGQYLTGLEPEKRWL